MTVVEMIHGTATGRADRPIDDIEMRILSPWPYVEGKRHISRSECVALNEMAEEIASTLNQ